MLSPRSLPDPKNEGGRAMTPSNPTTTSNPIIPSNTTQRLIEMLLERDASGQRKYNHTLDRSDLLCEDWAQHAIEESLDRAGYLLRMVDTAAAMRAENIRLAEENLRLRSAILPFVEFAKTLDIEPTPQAEAVVVEAPVHNILTDDKMLSQVPSVSEPMPIAAPVMVVAAPIGMTAQEIAAALGCHKDSIHNYKKAGLLPEPVRGTGGHPHNPLRYALDIEELREKVKARQEAAKVACIGKIRKVLPTPIAPPEPTFDINEEGKLNQIEQGKSTYRLIKIFYLARRTTDSGYLWDSQPNRNCDLGWEVVEEWRCNGLGRWESTPEVPGVVGTGNGITQGAGAYKVPVLG
jgi:hypothetical protein